ncbi:ribbon-helix-helix domain-containing protein [Marivivens sp. JLT3646]|uniref:ribbon-helix-helix domain-containing protein n=1 Tax=Marivivens sp. JLT3646 TaxID=1920883 RepID=UPI0009382ADF|nr:ribbon-helix-helix domain-containing protein [Marivivens sp. JLT3646]APO86594.1 hypothetical protein BSK21_05810 [Marivivens sp. JLT3646]
MSTNKMPRGRPPVDTEAVTVRLPRDIIVKIDEIRARNLGTQSRPDVIRRAIIEWLREEK